MIPTRLLPHEVTVQTAGVKADRYNSSAVVPDWDNATERTINARIEMVLGRGVADREETQNRSDAVSTWVVYTNDELTMQERLVWGDLSFDIDGPVAPVYASSTLHHYEALLRARV
jgi:hypothetical protein